MNSINSIEIQNVSHRYNQKWALSRINFTVQAGQCLTLLGPNGAGKTTLLEIISSLVRPTNGDVLINGRSLKKHPRELKKLVGFVGHNPLLYPHLSIIENLIFFGQIYSVESPQVTAENLLEQIGIKHIRFQKVGSLSFGEKQRAAIARALMHTPQLLLLDEPFVGLDFLAANKLDSLLQTLLTNGHTLILTTHNIRRGIKYADNLAILSGGEVVFESQGSPQSESEIERIYANAF